VLYLGVESGGWLSNSSPHGNGFRTDGHQSFHGPYARSEEIISVHAGEHVSLSFSAVANVDAYEVFGFLRQVDPVTGELSTTDAIELFARRGADTGGWINISTQNSHPNGLPAGEYIFEFVAGSYDATGGQAFGSNLWVDDIRLTPSSAIDKGLVEALAGQVRYSSTGEADLATPAGRTVLVDVAALGAQPQASTFGLEIPSFDQLPTWSGTPATLASILEDAADPQGATVASLFQPVLADPDVGETIDGVAVHTNGSDHLRGAWQYSTDGGANWQDIGEVGPGHMLLLDGSALVRFLPAADWNTDLGKLPTLAVHGVQGLAPEAFTDADGREYLDLASPGDDVRLSADAVPVATTVIPVNDPARFPTEGIDLAVNGAAPAELGGYIAAYDPDGDTLAYSIPNGTKDAFSPLGAGVETWKQDGDYGTLWVNQTTGEYVYQPNPEAIEALAKGVLKTDSFDVQVSDGEGGLSTQAIRIAVSGTNQAPVASQDTVTLDPIAEDDGDGWNGATAGDLFGPAFADIDKLDAPDQLGGLAINVNDSDGVRGNWEYSLDGGTTWNEVGEVSASHALLLDADTLLRFHPRENWNSQGDREVPALAAHLVDSSFGGDYTAADARHYLDLVPAGATGGATPVSADAVALAHDVTAVNDAPYGEIQLSGIAQVGATLKAAVSVPLSDIDGPLPVQDADDFGYQWQRWDEAAQDWADIPDANGMSYTLQADDGGVPVRFVARYTDDDGHLNVLASQQGPVVAHPHSQAGGDAPLFTGASANAGTLTLRYTDDGTLDPASLPDAAQFRVLVGGAEVPVSAIAIDGPGKTMSLTLETPVRPGQSVRIWYHPEIDGDADQPLQDDHGHAAGELLGVTVRNDTPYPESPAPETPQRPIGEVVDGRKKVDTDDDGTTTTRVDGKLGNGRVTEIITEHADGGTDYQLVYTPGDGGGGVLLPLLYEDIVGSPNYTSVALPSQVHLVAHGLRLPDDQAGKLDLIEAIRIGVDGGDGGKPGMLDGGRTFLDSLPDGANLWVNRLELGASEGAESIGRIVIDGAASGASRGDHLDALVIDASALPAGTTLELRDLDFAVVVGDGIEVVGNNSHLLVFGDDGRQSFALDGDHVTVQAGGGDDTVALNGDHGLAFGNAGNDVLAGGQGPATLHGGLDHDVASYAGGIEDYEIVRDHGITWVTSLANPDQVHQLINIESIAFDNGIYTVQNDLPLTWIASLYGQVLGRQAEVTGFQYWAEQYAQGKSIGEIGLWMLYSAEYNSTEDTQFSALSSADQIALLYQHFLGREAESGGHAYWVNQAENGVAIHEIANAFITSEEMAGSYLQPVEWDFHLA